MKAIQFAKHESAQMLLEKGGNVIDLRNACG